MRDLERATAWRSIIPVASAFFETRNRSRTTRAGQCEDQKGPKGQPNQDSRRGGPFCMTLKSRRSPLARHERTKPEWRLNGGETMH